MVFVTTSQAPPLDSYLELTGSGRFTADSEQRKAVEAFDRLWHALCAQQPDSTGFGRFWQRLTGRSKRRIPGIYLWGDVGRGKTWLMDLFFESLPIQQKRRIHFHRFMQRIHDELRGLQHVSDPLPQVARQWSEGIRILCLDEFIVSDIADAMLLSGLLEALFERGVTLVTTSNSPPNDLYRDGLQRAKFLPAIDRLKRYCKVVEVAGVIDYRLRILEQSETYHFPLDKEATAILEANYEHIACGSDLDRQMLVNERLLTARRRSDGVAWFDFLTLCDGPRGSADYGLPPLGVGSPATKSPRRRGVSLRYRCLRAHRMNCAQNLVLSMKVQALLILLAGSFIWASSQAR